MPAAAKAVAKAAAPRPRTSAPAAVAAQPAGATFLLGTPLTGLTPGHATPRCACGGGCPKCQSDKSDDPLAGLKRGQKTDRFESQARRIADRPISHLSFDLKGSHVRRGAPLPGAGTGEVLSSKARDGLRHFFPDAIIDAIRLHQEPAAKQMAARLHARAFAHGSHIYLGARAPAPGSFAGNRLLVHEITHVLQQSNDPLAPQLQCDDEETATITEAPAAFFPYSITTTDLTTLHNLGLRLVRAIPGLRAFVIVTDHVRFYDARGALLDTAALLGNFRPGNGVIAVGTDGNFDLGLRDGRVVAQPHAYSSESVSEDLRTRMAGRSGIRFSDWVDLTEERASTLGVMPFLMLVSDPPNRDSSSEASDDEPVTTEAPEGAVPTADGTPGAENQEGILSPTPRETPLFSPDFRDPDSGTHRSHDYAPLPAHIEGLDTQPVGGTGDFNMVLDYRPMSRDLLVQASWAFQHTVYRWEVWQLDPETDAATEEERVCASPPADGSTPSGRVVGRFEGTGRDWERTNADLRARREEITRDERDAWEDERYLDVVAGELNHALYDLEVASRYATQLLDTMGDVWARERERRIPWSEPGTYVVRCIAAIDRSFGAEGEALPVPAPSIATKVVRVQPADQISSEGIDAPEQTVDTLSIQLALLRRLPEGDPRRAEIGALEQQLALAQLDAGDASTELIRSRLATATAALADAQRASIFLPYGLHDERVSRLEREVSQLTAQLAHAEERTRVLESSSGHSARRARAVLISNVTGASYPLILLISDPYLDRSTGRWTCQIADITSSRGDTYTGERTNDPSRSLQANMADAAWEAVDQFVHAAPYGPGSLTVRLPSGETQNPASWLFHLPPADFQRSVSITNARDLHSVRARLEEIATIVAVLGLVIAPELGLVGAGLGAAISTDRLIHRYENGTLHLDAEAVGDIINILTAFTTGAQIIGRLERFTAEGGGLGVKLVRRGAALARSAETFLDYTNLVIANAELAGQFADIAEQERSGTMSAAQARRAYTHAFAAALQNNGIWLAGRAHAAHMEGTAAADAPNERNPATTREHPPPTDETSTARELSPETIVEPARRTLDESESRLPPSPEELHSPPPHEPSAVPPLPAEPHSSDSRPEGETALDETMDRLPPGTVMRPSDPSDGIGAIRMYENSITEDRGSEAALYYNPALDAFIVVQGDASTVYVDGPGGSRESPMSGRVQEWKALLEGPDTGSWELLAHYHPDRPGLGYVSDANRMPSGAAGDFGVIINEALERGGARSSRIDFNTPTGSNHTWFHFDAQATHPYRVDYPHPATGERTSIGFDSMQAYHDWFLTEFGVNLGPVPDGIRMIDAALAASRTHPTPAAPESTRAGADTPRASEPAVPAESSTPSTSTEANAPDATAGASPASPVAATPAATETGAPRTPGEPTRTESAAPSSTTDTPTPAPIITPMSPTPPLELTRRPNELESDFIHRVATTEGRLHWQLINGPAGRSRESPVRWARFDSPLDRLVAAMQNMQARLIRDGLGDLLPQVDETVLNIPLDEFIVGNDALRTMRNSLMDRIRASMRPGESITASPTYQELQSMLQGSLRAGATEGAARRPDIVEFFLDERRINITDVTTQSVDGLSVHAFKTLLYVELMKAIVGPNGPAVVGQDIQMRVDRSGERIDHTRTRFGELFE
jgi:hypothetical protein